LGSRTLRIPLTALCALFLPQPGLARDDEESGRPYEGRVLSVLTFHDPQSLALFGELSRFEAKTGARVKLRQIRHPAMTRWDDEVSRFSAFDLVAVDEPYLATLVPILRPFDEWPRTRVFEVPEVRSTGHPLVLEKSSVDGRLMGVPVNSNLYLYAFRKDLFSDRKERESFRRRYGRKLEPPATPEEFAELSEFFHRPPDLFGFAPVREESEAGTIELIWTFALFGERLLDENLEPAFDRDQARKALEWYRGLLAYAPVSEEDWHYEARSDLLRIGRLAHGMYWTAYLPDVLDMADSEVIGRLGFSQGPGEAGGDPVVLTGFWTAAIPKRSDDPQLASEFAAFWASRRTTVRLLRRGAAPSRIDVMTEPDLEGAAPWASVYLSALDGSVSRPVAPGYRNVSAGVARIFDAFIEGKINVEQALDGLENIGGERSFERGE